MHMWSVVSIDVYVWSGLSVELNGDQSQTFLPVDHAELHRHPVSDVFQKPINSSTLPLVHHSDEAINVVKQRLSPGDRIQLLVRWMI